MDQHCGEEQQELPGPGTRERMQRLSTMLGQDRKKRCIPETLNVQIPEVLERNGQDPEAA
tara:strand:+ start:129 stop:308 length:180 start_codon:yes stop_codon:yes gene_type:complete